MTPAIKIFAVLTVIAGLSALVQSVFVITDISQLFIKGEMDKDTIVSIFLYFLQVVLLFSFFASASFLGASLARSKKHHVSRVITLLILLSLGIGLINIMLFGIDIHTLIGVGIIAIYIVLSIYIDPRLSDERKNRRKKRKLKGKRIAARGDKAGRDPSGKGFISLNFFNLFWIYIFCSILGLVLETVFHFFQTGSYQDRAGTLFGPFSPIYGYGALLMTLALNRFYKKSVVLIFVFSALIGGVFEFLVSLFMQIAFGVSSWDYSGTWLSIDGRTNGIHILMWGLLGLIWIKLLLPRIVWLINRIPWNWRYTVTALATVLVLIDGTMTLMALDFWYERSSGKTPTTPVEIFFDDHFGDDYMKNRFQTMTIHPDDAVFRK